MICYVPIKSFVSGSLAQSGAVCSCNFCDLIFLRFEVVEISLLSVVFVCIVAMMIGLIPWILCYLSPMSRTICWLLWPCMLIIYALLLPSINIFLQGYIYGSSLVIVIICTNNSYFFNTLMYSHFVGFMVFSANDIWFLATHLYLTYFFCNFLALSIYIHTYIYIYLCNFLFL